MELSRVERKNQLVSYHREGRIRGTRIFFSFCCLVELLHILVCGYTKYVITISCAMRLTTQLLLIMSSVFAVFASSRIPSSNIISDRRPVKTFSTIGRKSLTSTRAMILKEKDLFAPKREKTREKTIFRSKFKNAQQIVYIASLALELIDNFKDDFVLSLLGMTWEEANDRYDRGWLNASYLPVPPLEIPYIPQDITYELIRSYSLMQHCVVSLEVLNLDQVLKNIYTHLDNTSKLADFITACLDDLQVYMDNESCSPDRGETEAMTSLIYNDGGSDWDDRDFIILRDIRSSLQNLIETFNQF
ncbi:hypothetical protein SK128_000199 [Halocaridina rubra]|uniref:Uncharacterized protein n=1 Tax=Halocaridina rubra TaxID=373956 RepID=A0AAN8ZYM4_HALRR